MKKKKYGVAVVVLIIFLCVGLRIYVVNINNPKIPVENYQMGDTVMITKAYTQDSDNPRDGYTVKVLGAELMTVNDFMKKYDVNSELINESMVKYYYLVSIVMGNTGNTGEKGSGISILSFSLLGTIYNIIPSPDIFNLINSDMPGEAFALRPQTEMEMIIPFEIIPTTHVDEKGFRKYPPKLQVLEYPVKKLILLEE